MKENIEIPLSKNKLFLGIAGSFIFVIIGVWLFTHSYEFQDYSIKLLRNPIIIKGIGVLAILFFGATGIYGFKKIFDKKVGLIIDSKGITDNSNGSSIGLIQWKDISNIRVKQVMSTKFLLIDVLNPEKYIKQAKGGIKSRLLRANMKMYGTPLSITSNTLKFNFEELEKLLQSEFKKNKV